MAKSGTFSIYPAAAVALLNSAAVQAEIGGLVQAAKMRADSMLPPDAAPFEADVQAGKSRAHGMVKTSSDRGRAGFLNRQAQAKSNILLKAVGL